MATDISKRGLGEIVDEACTLALKISNNIKREDSLARFVQIVSYLEQYVLANPAKWGIGTVVTLLLTNAVCWNAQDRIMDNGQTKESVAEFAIEAQQLNKLRNQLIGLLNDSQGIITEKSY